MAEKTPAKTAKKAPAKKAAAKPAAKPKTTRATKKPAAKTAASKAGTKSAAKPANGGAPAADNRALPMFYQSVVPLNAAQHGAKKIRPAPDFKFAEGANSIILSAIELPYAAKFYPIVFGESANGEVSAFAVTGHTNGSNLFVSEDGKWRENCYIPAYVRRYPFVLINDTEQGSLTLAMDTESGMITEDEGQPLYEDAKPTQVAQNALNFCLSYHQDLGRSREIFRQIADTGILEGGTADVQLPDKSRRKITGFQIVNEKKLQALDDDTFLTLRKSGALNLIYCQLWSMKVWDELLK